MRIEFENLDEVFNNIANRIDANEIKKVVGQGCALIERDAKTKAPKDTGALRRSITSEVVIDGNEVTGTVFTPLEYAPYVEYGTGLFAETGGRKDVPWCYQDDKGEWHTTSGQRPQPFMRPALDENRQRVLEMLKEAFR